MIHDHRGKIERGQNKYREITCHFSKLCRLPDAEYNNDIEKCPSKENNKINCTEEYIPFNKAESMFFSLEHHRN